ncbi:MAG: hypothetical protein GY793_10430 [Proteobacteria bacterium]|nr:hypothetical protein [Pseudomonadota bacterium]
MRKILFILVAVFVFGGAFAANARATSFKNPAFAGEWDPISSQTFRMTVKENGINHEDGTSDECHLIDNEQSYVIFFCKRIFKDGSAMHNFVKLQIDDMEHEICMIRDKNLKKLRKDNNGESWYRRAEPRFYESPFFYGEWKAGKNNKFLKGDIKITKDFIVIDNQNNALSCGVESVVSKPDDLYTSCWRGKWAKKTWMFEGKEYSSHNFEPLKENAHSTVREHYSLRLSPKFLDQPLWKIKELRWQLDVYNRQDALIATYHRTDKLPD